MDDITLDSLAAYAGFSRYTLSRMFRQHTGYTFTQCLSKRRVDMAMELLSGTKIPVTQVALQCGFNSIATFNRVFREIRGCTPTQYRVIYGSEGKGDAYTMQMR
jgi:transcriptional regulator GlxA family with amidase domain